MACIMCYIYCDGPPVEFHLEVPSSVLRVGVALISNGKLQVHKTPVSSFCFVFSFSPPVNEPPPPSKPFYCILYFFPSFPGKAAADQNAAWAAYYAQYYGQQPGGAMGAQAPGAPGEQPQAAPAPGGQPDYTKAWEEYYKKMGMSELEMLYYIN